MNVVLDGEIVEGAGATQSLDALRGLLRKRRLVPSHLRLDGVEIGLDRLAALSVAQGSVELDTVSLRAAVENSYDEAALHLPRMERFLQDCCDHLMLGRLKEAMASFGAICEGMNAFFSLMSPLDSLTGLDPAQGWSGEVEAMQPLLLATQGAVAQRDWVLVSDQLRYEWSPRIQLWLERLPQARIDTVEAAQRLEAQP